MHRLCIVSGFQFSIKLKPDYYLFPHVPQPKQIPTVFVLLFLFFSSTSPHNKCNYYYKVIREAQDEITRVNIKYEHITKRFFHYCLRII